MSLRIVVMVSLLTLLLIGTVAGRAVVGIVTNGLETGLPDGIRRFPGHHQVRYFTHTSLARILTSVDPQVAALQWWRAAAHAQSEEQINTVVTGLSVAKQRSQEAGGIEDALCPHLAEGDQPAHLTAVERVPLRCGPER